MKSFSLVILLLTAFFFSQGQVLLYQNHFENPISPPTPNCGPDLDANNVNNLWGGTGTGTGGGGLFTQQATVETILINGPNNQYNDPSGIGGNYSLGFLSAVQDDKLSLTLNAQNYNFINLSFSIAGIDLAGCGGPFGVTTPAMNIKLYNSPSGTFSFSSPGTLLDEKNVTGIAASPFTFNWATVTSSLNAAGITNQFFTIVFDLTASGYGSIDNIVIVASNNAPIVTATNGSTAFTEGTSVAVDAGITVTDSDNTNLASATISITTNFQSGEDVLLFTDQNGITGSYNAATGVLTLTGSSSVANYQNALRSLLYNNSTLNPNTANRTISFIANDGVFNSNTATKTVTITAVNNSPVVTTSSGNTNYGYISGTPVAVDTGITLTDADNVNLTSAVVSIITNFQSNEDVLQFTDQNGINGSYNSATGVLTLTGISSVVNYQTALRNISYDNISSTPNTANRTISFVVNDGAENSNAPTKTITINAFPLPLVLLSFKGNKVREHVQLKWETANEINTSHFIVERSKNGITFSRIGQVTSANRPGTHAYFLKDLQPESGLNYYRLKQTDNDGMYKHSSIVKILFDKYGNGIIVYPNPVKKDLHIKTEGFGKQLMLQVYNKAGQLIMQLNKNADTILKLDVNHLASGEYVLQLSDGVKVAHAVFIKD